MSFPAIYHKVLCSFWIIFLLFNACIYAQILNNSVISKLKLRNEEEINSPNLEFSPAFFGDKIAFVHAEQSKSKKADAGINEPFFDLVNAEVETNGKLSKKVKFNSRINSDFHEGPLAYDSLRSRLYFTRAGIEKKRVRGILRDTSVRKIMVAEFEGSSTSISEFELNSRYYSVCHPAISKDGQMMIFAADRPDGFGGMDLYACFFDGKRWSGVVNLGPNINTSSNEIFPALVKDSFLIFSSDRTGGTGGLDIYVSALDGGLWTTPEIPSSPLNSIYDDFGLIVRNDGMSGYFSSNRPGGRGKDDIYSFSSTASVFKIKEAENYVKLHLNIIDKLSFDPVASARIEAKELQFTDSGLEFENFDTDILKGSSPGNIILKITPKTSAVAAQTSSDQEGNADVLLKEKYRYIITVTSGDHEAYSIIYAAKLFGDTLNIVMEPVASVENPDFDEEMADEQKPDTEPRDFTSVKAGTRIIFENIYYNYNSAEILPGEFVELDSLASWMLQNPFVRIRLESHTDSRGNDTYNLLLSVKRGESVKSYLIEKGIAHDRIDVTGMGESRIRNQCKNGVKCTEKQHQYNRRTEVVILENE